ncbi:MAG: amino acid permease [Legionellales bacterium]|nr:amino acid permease [Legionellales bacterium]
MSDDALNIHASLKKPLGVFALVMINVIAIDNLRTLPFSAEFGLSLVSIYVLAAIFFLIPVGFAAAELATTWPARGGIYIWIREAFGPRAGFFIIWLQWIYNVVWYPTALAFILGAFAYLVNPHLFDDRVLFFTSITALFWLATLANCFGMRISSMISTIGTLIGTLLPMSIIIGLAAYGLLQGHPNELTLSWKALLPNTHTQDQLPFLVEVIFGLVGIEMSAMHADQVAHPQESYPRAIAWSIMIICTSLILSSLAIAGVVPHAQLNVITGISQALTVFLDQNHLQILHPLLTTLIIMGGTGGVAAWIIGPTKGLLMAAQDGLAPQYFSKVNPQGVPVRILLLQALLFTGFAYFYIWMPKIESAYVVLTVMTTQLSLWVYIGLFAALWRLRHIAPHRTRPYRIPGGRFGLIACCALGGITCLMVIGLGFVPPPMLHDSLAHYAPMIGLGMILLCLPPFIISHYTQRKR